MSEEPCHLSWKLCDEHLALEALLDSDGSKISLELDEEEEEEEDMEDRLSSPSAFSRGLRWEKGVIKGFFLNRRRSRFFTRWKRKGEGSASEFRSV